MCYTINENMAQTSKTELKYLHATCTIDISPGVELTCITTGKFKTGCLTFNMINALDRSDAACSALLPRVLRRGSAALPDMELIAAALDDLYGVRVEPIVRKKGELHCVGFYCDFPDDRFIPGRGSNPGGGSILEEAVSLVGGLLLSPDMRGGLLREDYVASEKSNLIDDIRASINDKRGYSIDRLLEEMCAGEAYGVNKLGDEKQAQAITPESLTAHYNTMTANSMIRIFYCGTAEPSRVESAIRSGLAGLPERGAVTQPKTDVILYPAGGAPRRFTETLDVNQGKLTVGYRLGAQMETPDYPAMMVFNTLFGGSVTSKLFLNVREKLSLCYYASSMLDRHKGVMVVASGVDFSNFEKALDEIQTQLRHIKNGDVSERELDSAKQAIFTSIKSSMDSPGGLEELYFDRSVAAVAYDPEKLCEMVEAVTLERVVGVASGIETDSVYFLNGKDTGSGTGG